MRSASEDGVTSFVRSAHKEKRYEKRLRYKTREDKYDVVKRGRSSRRAEGIEAPARRATELVAKRHKKKIMATAREVVDTFASEAILKDRLTMKPGLYQNGRVSVAKPLTDLIFHEMRFLSQPKQPVPEPALKSHRRGKRREEEELEKLSTYFSHRKPVDMPINERERRSNTSRLSSVPRSDNLGVVGRLRNRQQVSGHPRPRDIPSKHTHLNRENTVLYSANEMASQQRLGSNHAADLTASTRSSLGLVANSKHHSPSQPTEQSQGEESIRIAMAKTGIFKNTGIEFDPNASDGVETLASLPARTHGPVRSIDSLRKAHLGPLIVRYRDQGTMVAEQVNDERDWQSINPMPGGNKTIMAPTRCEAPNLPNNRTCPRDSPTRRITPGKNSVFHTETVKNAGEDDQTIPNAQRIPERPGRPDAPEPCLVNRHEAMARMPPPPRPPVDHPQGDCWESDLLSGWENASGTYIRHGAGIGDANHMSMPSVEASLIASLAPALRDQAGMIVPMNASLSAGFERSTTYESAQVISAVDSDTWPTPTAIRNSNPSFYPRIAGNATEAPLFDSQGQNYFSSLHEPPISSEKPHLSQGYDAQSSMRDYITKIEEEVLLRAGSKSPDDATNASLLAGCPEHSVNRMSRDMNALSESHQCSRSSSRLNCREQGQPFENTQFVMEEGFAFSTGYRQLMPDWRQPTPVADNMDNDEQVDMIQFWRPSQF